MSKEPPVGSPSMNELKSWPMVTVEEAPLPARTHVLPKEKVPAELPKLR